MTTPISSSSSTTVSARLNVQSLRSSPEPRVLELKPSFRRGEPDETSGRDRVELSDRARLGLSRLDRLNAGDDAGTQSIRADLVQRVKAEIAAGTYETPEKLAYAIGRLSGHLDVTA